MCLFHKLFVRHKRVQNEANDSIVNRDNLSIYNNIMGCSEVAAEDSTIEEKVPLDEQIRNANKKRSTSEDTSASGDSVRDIGPRIPITVKIIGKDR